jgi:hypothetical protein
MYEITKIQGFDVATPRIELSRHSGSISRALALGFPVLVRVQDEEDIYRKEMKLDHPLKGWYQVRMATIQDVDNYFEGFHVTFFVAWTLEAALRGKYSASKPQESFFQEINIARDLLQAGIDDEIAISMIGWAAEEVPFIYASAGHWVTNAGLDKYSGQKVFIELWIGTKVPIQAINGHFDDQSMDILCQWWGHTYKDAHKEFTRMEITPMSGNRFVERLYKDVGGMGQFDGRLAHVSVHIPENREWIFDGRPRNMWRVHPVNIKGTASVNLRDTNVGSATTLNGLGQMTHFHVGEVYNIKAPARVEPFESGSFVPVQFFKA